jgi:hypothetical protein
VFLKLKELTHSVQLMDGSIYPSIAKAKSSNGANIKSLSLVLDMTKKYHIETLSLVMIV